MKRLVQLPVLSDNYIYVVVDVDSATALVVDPATADDVLAFLAREGLTLTAVLNTHHHADHTGGNVVLRERTGCAVIGPERDRARIPAITRGCEPSECVSVGAFAPLRVLDVNAHTSGHVAYADDDGVDVVVRHGHGGVPVVGAGGKVVFVGDALFGAGCGRLFEGDGDDLFRALSVIDAEDPAALIACAHEYTKSNLLFARHAFPDVDAIANRLAGFETTMGAARSSVPSTLGLEQATNPFLLALRQPDPAAKAFALRREKDTFRA